MEFGTTEALWVWSSISGRSKKQNLKMYAVFIDFTKIFDTVSREGLWLVLRRFECTEKVINLIMALHSGMQAKVV